MTGETDFNDHSRERDEQGFTVWQRLDALDRAVLSVSNRVDVLERDYAGVLKRLSALEQGAAKPYDMAPARAALLPSDPVPFGTVDRLVEQITRMFDCRNGDYRSFHTNLANGEHYPYFILGLLAPASIPDAQERLRQAVYTSFLKLKQTCKSERARLYWRYGAAQRVLEDVDYKENLEGRREVRKYKIMTRIAIPEADFEVVSDITKGEDGIYTALKECRGDE